MKTILVLLLVGGALPVQAAGWHLNCDMDASPVVQLDPGSVACYEPTTNTDDSTIVDMTMCENIDVELFTDKDGDATTCSTSFDLQACPANIRNNSSETIKDAACVTLDGTSALAGNVVESNLASVFLRVEANGDGANPGDCQLLVKCAQRSN